MTEARELEEAGAVVEDDVVWDDIDILRPGMDFKDGLAFVTLPATLNVIKKVKRGTKEIEVPERVKGLACITSAGGQFRYTAEDVARLGYGYPDNVVVPLQRRWSPPSIKAFVAGSADVPNPVELYADIRQVYETYIEFAHEEYYDIMTLFVMGSYVFRLFHSLGYIHFNGTAASGKSQNLNILKALAERKAA